MALTLNIESLAAGGDGFGHLDGRAVFVERVAPGDVVEVELFEERERSARARVLRRLVDSPQRVEPGCPHAETCGGCHWLHVSLDTQAQAKQTLFRDALERIGGIARGSLELRPLVRANAPLAYRHRARLHVESGRLGYRARSSHALVEPTECRLLEPKLEAALPRLREALAREGPVPRCADVSIACDATRVTAAFHVDAISKASLSRAERVMRAAGLDGAVVAAIEPGGPARLLGDALLSEEAPLAAPARVYSRADLFAQANRATNERLVALALEGLGSPGRVLELFSGAGNFTFAAARRSAQVTAVEASSDALDLARRSARETNPGLIRFVLGDALGVALGLSREGQRYDALLLDPPRPGAKGVGKLAAALGVRRVVYVSCDPATLARDARELCACGFRGLWAAPVDMFPQTCHVEGVLVLERG
jgi:23S rRNA (uracil1939-C5)-methyltransferase